MIFILDTDERIRVAELSELSGHRIGRIAIDGLVAELHGLKAIVNILPIPAILEMYGLWIDHRLAETAVQLKLFCESFSQADDLSLHFFRFHAVTLRCLSRLSLGVIRSLAVSWRISSFIILNARGEGLLHVMSKNDDCY